MPTAPWPSPARAPGRPGRSTNGCRKRPRRLPPQLTRREPLATDSCRRTTTIDTPCRTSSVIVGPLRVLVFVGFRRDGIMPKPDPEERTDEPAGLSRGIAVQQDSPKCPPDPPPSPHRRPLPPGMYRPTP